ncbi:MAG: hypothetical protein ACSHW7_14245, partial [Patiriisocius sp.]|uniref:Ig-like domain-containing protein n=1 Tax=Patiriisocius sp. TaxID=2822396 RepID=UPI003EF9E19B
MCQNLLFPERVKFSIAKYLSILSILFSIQFATSQNKIFADHVVFSENTDNPGDAVLDNNDFATLNSYGGIAVGVLSYNGILEIGFANPVPAKRTTFVKIDFDEDVLNSLLGGSLGTLLADVLGNVVLGDHYFNIEARNNATTVLSNSSIIPPNDESFRIVQDALGDFYIAITPNQSYNRIYIEDNTNALLVGLYNSMNVYNAFYFDDNQCATNPLFTDFDGTGITADIINLGGAGVTNPQLAIDGDENTYSELSLGVLGVLASMRQNVYFHSPYTPNDEIIITLSTDPTLLTLGLLNNVEVVAFDGVNQVFETDINSIISLDVLTLLQNGQTAEIPISPNVSFDRVSVRLTSLLNVNLAQSIDIHEISIAGPSIPTTNDIIQNFCAVDTPTINDLQVNEASVIWYDALENGNAYLPTDVLTNGNIYYAAQIINGCESNDRLAVTANINDAATPTTDNTTQEFCAIDNPTIADLQTNEPNITWYDAPNGGNAYAPTEALVDGQDYYASQIIAGCESSVRLMVTANINDAATPTTDNTTQEFCAIDNPTIADLQTNEPNITWYDAPNGGNAYAPTEALVDGQDYYASQIIAGCESSVRLMVTANINDAATPTTDDTTQEFCAIDNPTIADLQTNEPNITWYDAPNGGNAYAPTEALVDGQDYYASQIIAGCESSVRLMVTANINDAATPTTDDTTQEFCAIDNPTIADLQTNEPNITWYDAPNGGNAYAPT